MTPSIARYMLVFLCRVWNQPPGRYAGRRWGSGQGYPGSGGCATDRDRPGWRARDPGLAMRCLPRRLVAELEAVMVEGVADPRVAQAVRRQANIILAPDALILERVDLPQPVAQVPGHG